MIFKKAALFWAAFLYIPAFPNSFLTGLSRSTNIFLVKNFSVSTTRLRSLLERPVFDEFGKASIPRPSMAVETHFLDFYTHLCYT